MESNKQLTLDLPDDLERFVRDEVRKGDFPSTEAYVVDLIHERFEAAQRDRLDAAIDRGIADAEGGRVMDVELAFQRLRQEMSGRD